MNFHRHTVVGAVLIAASVLPATAAADEPFGLKDLCNSVNRADVKFTAQNGMTANSKPVLTSKCKKGKKGKGKKANGKGKGAKRSIAWLSGLGF